MSYGADRESLSFQCAYCGKSSTFKVSIYVEPELKAVEGHCPFCNSLRLHYYNSHHEDKNTISQGVKCGNCEKRFYRVDAKQRTFSYYYYYPGGSDKSIGIYKNEDKVK